MLLNGGKSEPSYLNRVDLNPGCGPYDELDVILCAPICRQVHVAQQHLQVPERDAYVRYFFNNDP
jgi:hypothetical protein